MIWVERPFGSTRAEAMTEIRAWLDHRKIQTTSFQPVYQDGGVGFQIGFKSEDEAELFRQEFGGVTSTEGSAIGRAGSRPRRQQVG